MRAGEGILVLVTDFLIAQPTFLFLSTCSLLVLIPQAFFHTHLGNQGPIGEPGRVLFLAVGWTLNMWEFFYSVFLRAGIQK